MKHLWQLRVDVDRPGCSHSLGSGFSNLQAMYRVSHRSLGGSHEPAAGRDLFLGHNAFEDYQEPEAFGHLAVEAFGPLRRRVQQLRSLLQAK